MAGSRTNVDSTLQEWHVMCLRLTNGADSHFLGGGVGMGRLFTVEHIVVISLEPERHLK